MVLCCPHRLEAEGREATDVPVDAHSRPLLDERRAGGFGFPASQIPMSEIMFTRVLPSDPPEPREVLTRTADRPVAPGRD